MHSFLTVILLLSCHQQASYSCLAFVYNTSYSECSLSSVRKCFATVHISSLFQAAIGYSAGKHSGRATARQPMMQHRLWQLAATRKQQCGTSSRGLSADSYLHRWALLSPFCCAMPGLVMRIWQLHAARTWCSICSSGLSADLYLPRLAVLSLFFYTSCTPAQPSPSQNGNSAPYVPCSARCYNYESSSEQPHIPLSVGLHASLSIQVGTTLSVTTA